MQSIALICIFKSMQETSPDSSYNQQLEKHTSHLSQLLKFRSKLGWVRLLVFVATVLIAIKVFTAFGTIGVVPVITGIGLLLYLVSADVTNNEKIRNTKTLILINSEELQALNHQYTDREDGSRFLPADHEYAADLDIFGKASIYQWLSRCFTEKGQHLLAENLLQPLSTLAITSRQEALKEVAPQLEWRQQWQARSMQTKITSITEKRIVAWAKEEEKHFAHPAWKVVVGVYSILTLASAVAALTGYISNSLFSTLFLFYFIISLLLSSNTISLYNSLNGIVKEIFTLQSLISWLEKGSFQSSHLKGLQNQIKTATATAAEEIKNLKTILDRFDLRYNVLIFIFFNAFLLWDVRQIIALNHWRKRNKTVLPQWFDAVAEMEVLHSLATVHFNQPKFSFPQFTTTHFTLICKGLGHPLLPPQQRVTNNFDLAGTGKIGLITGSNMAGKSTFLRSLGVNIILAQTGSAVCASSFLLSPVQLVSSMRIADNLAENTSTFYAELKKLRTIIEEVKAHHKIFILLDEILRGTNSYDRHKGSVALIKQLIKEEAVAVLATHDVELAGIKKDYPDAIDNYHFDVEVEGEELFFDYKLKPGVCTSLNASILMKKIGIDLD
jgi:ABC-type enterochelin transport system ATPase subunit